MDEEGIYFTSNFIRNTRFLVNSSSNLKQRENAKTRFVNRDGDITRQGLTVIMKKSGGNAITRVINDKRRFSSATSYS